MLFPGLQNFALYSHFFNGIFFIHNQIFFGGNTSFSSTISRILTLLLCLIFFFSWRDWKRSIWSIQRFRSSIKPFPNLAYFRAEGAGRTHQQYTRGTGEETNNFISCQSSPEFTCSCKNLNGEPTESPGWERRGSRVSGFQFNGYIRDMVDRCLRRIQVKFYKM